ncbi:hypothetical protein BKN37_13560 [Mycobacterium talmoniae]|uniref:Uncharacterized protein n=1 Tax=Mycobacterium talmoniae TaxID=1858794 RepID=A0A1S1NDE4_9MYCO|nr:hypothetical protein BKN37_13560 [Mycobacterium talmoniae]
MRPGAVIWPNGAYRARVLAVLACADDTVVVITESGGYIGCFTTASDDGYYTQPGPGTWVATARTWRWIHSWHQDRGLTCCGMDGPFCRASIGYAFDRLRRAGLVCPTRGRP